VWAIHGFFNTVCSGCLKPVHVASGSFLKPFHDSTSDFRNTFKPIGIELVNSSGFQK
jgi:hypothetical protein